MNALSARFKALAKSPVSWGVVATAAVAFTWGVSAQNELLRNNIHNPVAELATVVVGPIGGASPSPNLGSRVNFGPNDEVLWVVYHGAPQSVIYNPTQSNADAVRHPERVTGTVTLPKHFMRVAGSFLGPPSTTLDAVQPEGKVAWTQNPHHVIKAEDTAKPPAPAVNTTVVTVPTVNINDYFRCDSARANIARWDKLRFSRNGSWGGDGGLTSVTVEVSDANGVPFPPAMQPAVLTTVQYWVDISNIPPGNRVLNFKVSFRASGVTPDMVGQMIDVTWVGDQAQTCFKAQANSANLDNYGYSTELDISRTVVTVNPVTKVESTGTAVSLKAGHTLNSRGSAAGFGGTPLVIPIQVTSQVERTIYARNYYDTLAYVGDMQVFKPFLNGAINNTYYHAASEKQRTIAFSDRSIYTRNGEGTSTADGFASTPFIWENVTNLQLRTDLCQTLNGRFDISGLTPNPCKDRLNYLRGDPANESAVKFRVRELGSLVESWIGPVPNSSPALSRSRPIFGYSERLYPGFNGYVNATKATDDPWILFGGYGGFLHGYSVDGSGVEQKFAYIPSFLFKYAYTYSNVEKTKLGLNPFGVDSTPMVRDVALSTSTNTPAWRTAVVASLGWGQRGIFALDITRFTTAEANSKAVRNVLWEYSNESKPVAGTFSSSTRIDDLKDLGQMVYAPPIHPLFGAEQIVRMANGRWAALVGNGIRSEIGPNPASNGTGRAVLYLFYFGDENQGDRWLRIPVSETDPNLAFGNGLMSPRPLDIDNDGKVDFIYAGDYKGNLWRFDVRKLRAKSAKANEVGNVTIARIFKNPDGQPIVSAPVVRQFLGTAACIASNSCWMLGFGTGYPISPVHEGPLSPGNQFLYGIVDNLSSGDSVAPGTFTDGLSTSVSDGDLVTQTLANVAGSSALRNITATAIDYSSKKGWKLGLRIGEQLVGNPQMASDGSVMFATTRRFNQSATALSNSWLTQIGLVTGAGVKVFTHSAVFGASIALNGGPIYGTPPVVAIAGGGSGGTTEKLAVPDTSAGNLRLLDKAASPNLLGRLSWREVFGGP
jgi:hypothetical protein